MIEFRTALLLSAFLIHTAYAGGSGGNGANGGGAGGAAGSNGAAGIGTLGGGGGGGNSISATAPNSGNGGNGAGASPGTGGAKGLIGSINGTDGTAGASGSGSGGGGGGNTTLLSSPNTTPLTGGTGGNAGGTPGNGAGGGGAGDGAIITAPVTITQAITGGRGGNGTTNGGGAGGGGAGIVFTPTPETLTISASITGGAGGQGYTINGGGGGGGAGVAVNASGNTVTNNNQIKGGAAGSCDNNQGGTGGDGIRGLSTITNITNNSGATITGGNGSGIGAGGKGINVARGTITNFGTIIGGAGGGVSANIATGATAGTGMGGATGYIPNTNPGGVGSAAILCTANASTIINAGTITPGTGQSDAIQFTSTGNILEIYGTSVINGNVTGATSSTFRLAGDTDASFNLNDLGTKYQGFTIFQKKGLSTWTLTGTNTALWTVTQGTLKIGNGSTSGDLSGNLTNSGTVIFDRSDDVTYPAVISGFGDAIKNNTNTLTLTGNNTLTGTFTVNQGILSIGNGGTTGFITNSIINNGQVIYNRSNTVTHTGAISGTGSLTKVGANTVRFTNDLSYTGGTTISAGVFQVGNNSTTGSLTGDVTNNGTLTFSRSNDYTYTGNVSGTGNFSKLGAATLTLTGNLLSSGTKTISAGTLQIGNGSTSGSISGNIANSGTLILNKSNDWTYSNVISGAGSLIHNGTGTTTLTGANTYTGATTINAGTLRVNGSLTSGTTTVAANGTLSGSGSVRNIVNNGTVQAGNSTIGTLTVNGTYTQTGILNTRLDGNGQADILNMTGTATLGGTLNVIPTGGNLPTSYTYTLLNASSVSGTFSTVTGSSSVFSYTPIYEANRVRIQITRVANIQSGYQGLQASVVANYLNSLPYSSSIASLISSLNQLNSSDLTTALRQLSGADSNQRSAQTGYMDMTHLSQPFTWAITDRLSKTFKPEQILAFQEILKAPLNMTYLSGGRLKLTTEKIQPTKQLPYLPIFETIKFDSTNLWIQGTAGSFHLDNVRQNSFITQGFKGTHYSTTAGIDRHITPTLALGILFGTGIQDAKGNITKDQHKSTTVRLGTYATYDIPEVAHLFASLVIARHRIDSNRVMTVIPAVANRSYIAWGTGGFLEINRDFIVKETVALSPFAQLAVTTLHEPDITEKNAGAQNLRIQSRNTLIFGKSLGIQASTAFHINDSSYVSFVRIGLNHYNTVPNQDRAIVKLVGQSKEFSSLTPTKNQITGLAKLGTSVLFKSNLKLTAAYDGEFGSSLQKHQATLKFDLAF